MNGIFDTLDPLTGLTEQGIVTCWPGDELIMDSDSYNIDHNVDEILFGAGDLITPQSKAVPSLLPIPARSPQQLPSTPVTLSSLNLHFLLNPSNGGRVDG
jgi:hypothetical protein